MDEDFHKHLPLVRSLVRRYSKEYADSEDLFQVGCIGLIKALRRYDKTKGTAFTTYAVPVITGEIKMYLRGHQALKYSRALISRAIQVKKVQAELEQRLGRRPALSELSAVCGLEREELLIALDALRKPLSLDSADMSAEAETAATQESAEQVIERVALQEALSYLPERERQIVMYRFFAGRSQQDTANMLDISQMHVSRLEKKILAQLKKHLTV